MDVIRRKLEIIDEEMKFLKEMRRTSLKDFQRDSRNVRAVCNSFQKVLQAIIDIGNHIISSLNLGKPEVYEDIANILYEKGIVSCEMKSKMIKMIKFRNFLVHEYDKVDQFRIYKILNENLEDVESIVRIITSKILP